MPSPFPGMNPYFEQAAHGQDFHTEFLSSLRRLLAPRVAPSYVVQLEEHVYLHDLPPEPRRPIGRADLSVTRAGAEAAGGPSLGVLEAPRRSGSRPRTSSGPHSWKSATAAGGMLSPMIEPIRSSPT